jgi:hypothetical protein
MSKKLDCHPLSTLISWDKEQNTLELEIENIALLPNNRNRYCETSKQLNIIRDVSTNNAQTTLIDWILKDNKYSHNYCSCCM